MPGTTTDLLFKIDADADQAIREFAKVKAAVPNTADLTKGLGGVNDKLNTSTSAFKRVGVAASAAGVAFGLVGGAAMARCAASSLRRAVNQRTDINSQG